MSSRRRVLVRALQVGALSLFALKVSACGPATRPIGPPIALSSGDPGSPCEQASWLDVVPSSSTAATTEGYGRYTVTHVTTEEGYAVYPRARAAEDEPLSAAQALQLINDGALARTHNARIADVQSRTLRGTLIQLGGILGATGGVALAAVGLSQNEADFGSTTAAVGGVTLIVGGLVASIVGIILRPSTYERNHAQLEERMFFPQADDMGTVSGGIAQHNLAVRARCQQGPAMSAAR